MRFAYYRVSTGDQSIAAQRAELNFELGPDAVEIADEGVSGMVVMRNRPGFASLMAKLRPGDSVHVSAVDRLGRDAIDVQSTVRDLINSGVQVHINGLGVIAKGVGEIVLAVLAQVADMERRRIWERAAHGRAAAKASLAATGKTHRGKDSMGRPVKADATVVTQWRDQHDASIKTTANHFGLGTTTVKRYLNQAEKKRANAG